MELLALDTETTGLAYHDPPFGASVTSHAMEPRWFELPDQTKELQEVLLAHDTFVLHNAKFDLEKLILFGVISRKWLDRVVIHDTECLAHMVDANQRKALKVLVRDLLGIETNEEEELKAVRRKLKLRKEDGYHLLPREVLVPYALKDVEYTLALYDKLAPQVFMNAGLQEAYNKEMKVMLVLLDMEMQGMALDMEYLTKTTKQYAGEIFIAEMNLRDQTWEDFNPNSPKQVLEAFAAQGIELPKTDVETLERQTGTLARDILKYRELTKVHGTYLRNLLNEQVNGIVHPWFRQHRARTGRLASGSATE